MSPRRLTIKAVTLASDAATDDSLRRALDTLTTHQTAERQPTFLIDRIELLSAIHQAQITDAFRRGRVRARLIATLNADGQLSDKLAPALHDLVSTLTIHVPSLIDRSDDLPILAQSFLESTNRGNPKQIGAIAPESLDLLALYSWPGELDELREVIAAAHQAATSTSIIPANLPAVIHHASKAAALPQRRRETIVLDTFLAEIESEVIQRALSQAKGNKTEAAELLGMTRPRLYRRMQQLGLIALEAAAEELPTFRPVDDEKEPQLPDFQEIDAEDG
jgi:DNA-binding NtrC family response regulator